MIVNLDLNLKNTGSLKSNQLSLTGLIPAAQSLTYSNNTAGNDSAKSTNSEHDGCGMEGAENTLKKFERLI